MARVWHCIDLREVQEDYLLYPEGEPHSIMTARLNLVKIGRAVHLGVKVSGIEVFQQERKD